MQVNYENDEIFDKSKFNIEHYPAFKFLISVIIGLIFFLFIGVNIWMVSTIALLAIISLIAKISRVVSFFLLAFLLSGLISIRLVNSQLQYPNKVIQEMPATFIGKIDRILKKTKTNMRIIAFGDIDTKELTNHQDTGILLDIYIDSKNPMELESGNTIYAPVEARLPSTQIFPTDFDEKFYARYNDVHWLAKTKLSLVSKVNRAKSYLAYASDISRNFASRIDSLFQKENTGILKAMLLGDKSSLDKETKLLFSLTGTAHVLAVSGLHVGIISGIVLLMLGGIENRVLKFLIFSSAMLLYALLTGFSPSVVRAGIMAVSIFFVFAMERQAKSLNILSFAVILMIIHKATIIYSPGFQMSVASVFGIILLFPIIRSNLNTCFKVKSKIFDFFVSSFSVSLSASITVSPIIAYYFGIYSFVSPFANLFVIPLISLSMVFAIIALLLSVVYFPLGIWYAASADVIIKICMQINRIAVEIPYSFFSESAVFLLSIIMSLVFLYIFTANNKRKLIFRSVSMCIIVIPFWYSIPKENLNSGLKIYPLQKIVVAEIPLTHDTSFVFIADRRNKQYPKPDYGLFKYLASSDKNLILGVNGNVGIATYDKLKKVKNIKAVELSFDEQYQLEKELQINERLPQIIKIGGE